VLKWVETQSIVIHIETKVGTMTDLKGKILFITGASRGIGKAIALRAAHDGASIAIAAKTTEPHPKLPGTIYTAAEEIEQAGGKALPCTVDIRFEDQVEAAVDKTIATFGGIDILVNNASAIHLADTVSTPMKRYDLMHQINTRGTFLCSQKCIPHLEKADNPHILNISPPLNMDAKWFAPHVAYTMAKFGMSMCVLGMAEELKARGIAVNALWPRTTIATAAVRNLLGGEDIIRGSRKPAIMGDAAHAILTQPSRECTGHFFVDDDVLRAGGRTDFSGYAVDPDVELMPDFFL
jgi:citronellol/citronellal dehydrogenase